MSIPVANGGAVGGLNQAWTVLAHVLRPQGRKGEVLAELLTDFPERFAGALRVFAVPANFDGGEAEGRRLEVESFWLPTGRNQGRIVLQFRGVGSIAEAEQLEGLDMVVPDEERLPLEEGSSYICDLIGCRLFDLADPAAPLLVGVVADVQFATSPHGARRLEEAAPLLAVAGPDGVEVLVPFVKAFLLRIDAAAKTIEMSLPPGLLDVNR